MKIQGGQYQSVTSQSDLPTTVKRKEISKWLDQTIPKVITKLHSRIDHFKAHPEIGVSATTIEEQEKKFAFVEELLSEDKTLPRGERSSIQKIIKGYLVEFTRQSMDQVVPCNVEHDRNPKAKEYWESQSESSFQDAIFRGKFHTAVSYLHLQKLKKALSPDTRLRRGVVFHAVGEIIRATMDTFKVEYSKLDLVNPPVPSLYNDHITPINYSLKLEQFSKRD